MSKHDKYTAPRTLTNPQASTQSIEEELNIPSAQDRLLVVENWYQANSKMVNYALIGILAIVVGVFGYKYYIGGQSKKANDAIFRAQTYYSIDSINWALNGDGNNLGFKKIADKFSGTPAGNLANYYAGMAYLNTGKYSEAITYLEKFSSKDMVLSTLAVGAIGDAYSQKNQAKEALSFYVKAAEMNKNEFTTPRFLLKAGQTALTLGNKEEALKYFTEIKEKYDAMIGLAQ